MVQYEVSHKKERVVVCTAVGTERLEARRLTTKVCSAWPESPEEVFVNVSPIGHPKKVHGEVDPTAI
jgi:hypothetical protein